VRHGFECLFALTMLFMTMRATAQDLEPRAYSASPVGTNFVAVAFGRSNGSVLLDSTVPLKNVKATIYIPTVGVGRTFGFFGRQALLTVGLPYVWGHASGDLGEGRRETTRSGLADLRFKFALNLRGNPARSPSEFKTRKDSLIIGTSVAVVVPTGQYDATKLVNIGSNRFAFKPEVGISYPYRKFYFDAYFGTWFYTNNTDYFTGNRVRRQDPITALQAHVSYTFLPRLWLAADMTWYRGGAASVNDGTATSEQNNSRAGVTLSVPLKNRQSLKLAYSSATSASLGSDFNTLSVAWQFTWFGHR
jgi:hypothetical protein